MDITIGVVSFEASALLRKCLLAAMRELDESELIGEVMVVDNASKEPEVRQAIDDCGISNVMYNSTNVGFGSACNQIMERSNAEIVVLLNPDVEMLNGSLQVLIDALIANEKTLMVGPTLLRADGQVQRQKHVFPGVIDWLLDGTIWERSLLGAWYLGQSYNRYDHISTSNVDWIEGACMAVKRVELIRHGGFDESFFMYCEELDLCHRLSKSSQYKVQCVKEARAIHHGGGSTIGVLGPMRREFFRSKVLYANRCWGRVAALCFRGWYLASLLMELAVQCVKTLLPIGDTIGKRRSVGILIKTILGLIGN
tara:strand:- start:8956 stop:9888 length:933 start_codon:yes stop_codon:yes gene_type:complete